MSKLRLLLALGLLLQVSPLLLAQSNDDLQPPDRFGIVAQPRLYPQSDPKAALETAAKLLEGRRFEYLIAHVLDPQFVDARIADRIRELEPLVNKELQATRDQQRRDLDKVEREKNPPDRAQALRREGADGNGEAGLQDPGQGCRIATDREPGTYQAVQEVCPRRRAQ